MNQPVPYRGPAGAPGQGCYATSASHSLAVLASGAPSCSRIVAPSLQSGKSLPRTSRRTAAGGFSWLVYRAGGHTLIFEINEGHIHEMFAPARYRRPSIRDECA